MRKISEHKSAAKKALNAVYWPCVGIIGIFIGISAANSITGGLATLVLYPPIFACAMSFFVAAVGGAPQEIGTVFSNSFSSTFGRKLGGYWWMQLKVFLWSLLLIIPGIVKAYAYYFTMYILGEFPQVPAMKASEISEKITNGYKWRLFGFELSFIGWGLLASITCGLSYIFYSGPMYYLAQASLFRELLNNALDSGAVSINDLWPEGRPQQAQSPAGGAPQYQQPQYQGQTYAPASAPAAPFDAPYAAPAATASPFAAPVSPFAAPAAPASPYDTPSSPFDAPAAPASPFDAPAEPASPFDAPAAPASPFDAPAAPVSPFDAPAEPASPFDAPTAPASPFDAPTDAPAPSDPPAGAPAPNNSSSMFGDSKL